MDSRRGEEDHHHSLSLGSNLKTAQLERTCRRNVLANTSRPSWRFSAECERMKGSFVEPCHSLSPYLWIQVCREKYLQGTRGACLYGVWIKATNVKKLKDDFTGNKDKNGWMQRKAPSSEWGKEVRKMWSDNPPVPASSILEFYQQPPLWWRSG